MRENDHPRNRLRTPKRLYEPTQMIVRARPNGKALKARPDFGGFNILEAQPT